MYILRAEGKLGFRIVFLSTTSYIQLSMFVYEQIIDCGNRSFCGLNPSSKANGIAPTLFQNFNQQISSINATINNEFVSMFGDVITNSKNLPTTKVINVVTLQRGYDLPEKDRETSGSIPVYGSNGFVGYHNVAKTCNGIVTGRSGTIGEVHYVLGEYWPLNTSLFSSDTHGNNVIYLSYLLQNFHLERFFTGSGVPTLNRNDVHSEQIVDIDLSEQTVFADFASKKHKEIEKIKEEKSKICAERHALITKYFR